MEGGPSKSFAVKYIFWQCAGYCCEAKRLTSSAKRWLVRSQFQTHCLSFRMHSSCALQQNHYFEPSVSHS